jgi:hypothetical protein
MGGFHDPEMENPKEKWMRTGNTPDVEVYI